MRLNDFKLTEHFNLMEFQCPCCHTVKLQPLLLQRAVLLRSAMRCAVVINSAYRCALHNYNVGGVKNSMHRQGRALDIRVHPGIQTDFRSLALSCGFKKVILYLERSFAHVEI